MSNSDTTLSFKYNDSGIRTSKTVNGTETKYLLDGSTIVAQKTGDTILWFYYDGAGQLTAMQNGSNGEYYYYVYNHQGDVVALLDSSLNYVANYIYDSWGKVVSVTGSNTAIGNLNPFRYRGYYYDSETGLYYLNSRYYNPEIGRFINADELFIANADILRMNMFAYCGNNPIVRSDKSGKSWILLLIVIVVAATALSSCSTNTVGAAKEYVEARGGDRSNSPNCYAYAIGIYDKSYNPGDFSSPMRGYDVDSVASAVQSDLKALGRKSRIIDGCNAPISDNEYRIAVRVKSKPEIVYAADGSAYMDWDYHFMTQTSTGQWAEKHGPGGDSILHAPGETPDTISWDLGDRKGYYDSEIIYLAVSL